MPAPEPTPRLSWSLSPKTAPAPELQPDLFSSASKSEDGYSRWRAEAEAERVGLIQLVDDLSDHALQGTRKPLRLRIGDHLFLPVQIESLVNCED